MQGGFEYTEFSSEEKPRIALVGRLMRDIHVDELPRIVNVLTSIGMTPIQSIEIAKFIAFSEAYFRDLIQGFKIRTITVFAVSIR